MVSLHFNKSLRIQSIVAPEIEGKQSYREFVEGDAFKLSPKAGIVLEIKYAEG